MNNKKQNQNERAKQFLSCLGNGKSIYECEAENDMIDEYFQAITPQIKSKSIIK